MRKIGMHLRLVESMVSLLQEAQALNVPLFQCFLVTQSGFFVDIPESDIPIIQEMMQRFDQRYLHASYWSNLASVRYSRHRILNKELALAEQLGFTHIVIHPGSAKGARNRLEGVNALVRTLNGIFKHTSPVTIVLENMAHGNMSVGGTLQDFKLVLEKIDKPEKLFFCIDTAHAYSYGYDIGQESGVEGFIQELQQTVTLEKIVLLHLNDTYDKLGSHMDRHAIPGEGKIGEPALKKLVLDTRLKAVPLLMEPPVVTLDQQKALLAKITQWHVEY